MAGQQLPPLCTDAKDRAFFTQLLSQCLGSGPGSSADGVSELSQDARDEILKALLAVVVGSEAPVDVDMQEEEQLRPQPAKDTAMDCAEQPAQQQDNPAAPDDTSLMQLMEEVTTTSQRVIQLRESVPAAITKAVATEETWRPVLHAASIALTSTDITPGKMAWTPRASPRAGPGSSAVALGQSQEHAIAGEAAEMRDQLQMALDKLPNLRARMDEVSKRLDNILQVIDDQQALDNTTTQHSRQFTSPLKLAMSDSIVGILAQEMREKAPAWDRAGSSLPR